MRASPLRTLCVVAGAVLLLGACPLPILRGYDSDSRANVPATAPDSIKKGESTREDVLMQFGEPDTVAADESWVVYGSSFSLGGLLLFMFAGSGGAAVEAVDMRYRRMIIEFDRQGVTTEIILESRNCFQYGGGVINGSASGGKGEESKPCLDKLGLDVPEKFHLSSVRE
ncbi:exported protein of unknown function (plasmid) [Ralstonia solanacearum Po82]|uniref:Lipoprotein n=2 Tax=Ralstonia solanacearum TaxID=305 RepID=A0A5H2Q7X9_RALSL|nr:exported protein of unknown function [Ralstonia solanacearum Po82]AMP71501.1 hypothetical protein UW163_18475 [Ralstonia solanacearum]EUJ12859.1 hypothetical protein RSP673_18920 [Ralstonia solanacearum P673]AMP75930.1 hypothetical protein RALBFv3_17080 [Ralstonia solanacearum]AYB62627.1 hypothetical protein C2124_19055 [Ralstonia solanacearum]